MPKLKDANVLIIKEYPNRYISISSLLLSLGIKPYRMVNLNDPIEAVKRTFHQRFDVLICDQNYRDNQLKAADIIAQLRAAKVIDQGTVIVMDCRAEVCKDYSYYLADIPLHPESNQRDVTDRLRTEYERKNKVWPLLNRTPSQSEQDMEKRYQFFEQHYPEWQYDLTLSRGHYYLLNQQTKYATELYGTLIKQNAKKDLTLEICYFLNALALNGQQKEALALHTKFASGKRKLGQPLTEMGAMLQLAHGHLVDAYQLLSFSQQRYGMNLTQRTGLALIGIAVGKYDQALELFSNNLMCAKQLNQDVALHMLNYLFALVMSWSVNQDASALYQKKFAQLSQQLSSSRLSESQSVQLALLNVHADCLLAKGYRASTESLLISFDSLNSNTSQSCQLHALYISALFAKESTFNRLRKEISQRKIVYMFDPLAALNGELVKQLGWKHFCSAMAGVMPVTSQYPRYA